MGNLKTKTLVLSTAAILAMSMPSMARAQQRTFNLPAQPATKSVPEFARQAGIQIVAPGSKLRGIRTRAITGQQDVRAALRSLLEGTGLRIVADDGRTITLGVAPSATAVQKTPARAAPGSGEATAGSAAANDESADDILVTGSRLPNASGQPQTQVYDRAAIQASGQRNVVAFLNTLPAVSQMSAANPIVGFASPGVVQLRGLPVGTTLVLLDGQRVSPSANSATGTFDVNNIPSPLVERIDVVPFGSSAVYGSDAIAGVVNFILRKDLDGGSLEASFGRASKFSTTSVSGSFGRRWDRVSVGAAASYYRNDALLVDDRAITADTNYSRFASQGGADARNTFCSPGTVTAVSGQLPGVGASFAAIPATITGRPTTADFVAGAGQRNLCSFRAGTSLVPKTERFNGLAYVQVRPTDDIQFDTQLLYGKNRTASRSFQQIVASATVPATNPFNPFGVPVRVDTSIRGRLTGDLDESEFLRGLVGMKVNLSSAWKMEITGQISRTNETAVLQNQARPLAFAAALASTNPATAINLFSATSPASQELLDSIYVTVPQRYRGRASNLQAIFRGPTFTLPAGAVNVVIGFELGQSDIYSEVTSISSGTPVTTITDASRRIKSAFSEIEVPLIPGAANRPLLSASAALRIDDYSDFGDTITPQYALSFQPLPELSVRASYSEAFRAPSLQNLYRASSTSSISNVPDPQNGGAIYTFQLKLGGNPNLKAETGKTTAVTIAWRGGRLTPGLNATLTYWHTDEDNRTRVGLLTPQLVLANTNLFGDRVTRDATGRITIIDITDVNFGSLEAQGFDADVRYRFSTSIGEFTPSVGASLVTRFKSALTPGGVAVDRLGKPLAGEAWAPRLKATARIDWSRGLVSGGIAGRYLGPYDDYQTPANTNRLGNYWLVDLNARVDLSKAFPAFGRSAHPYLALAVANVFDRKPQYSNFSNRAFGYDPYQTDIIGRIATLTAGLRW